MKSEPNTLAKACQEDCDRVVDCWYSPHISEYPKRRTYRPDHSCAATASLTHAQPAAPSPSDAASALRRTRPSSAYSSRIKESEASKAGFRPCREYEAKKENSASSEDKRSEVESLAWPLPARPDQKKTRVVWGAPAGTMASSTPLLKKPRGFFKGSLGTYNTKRKNEPTAQT